jgi:very-short-patch-repair endonuclease
LRAAHWKEIAALASRQHGVVSYRQIVAAGCPDRTLRRAVDQGLFEPTRRGVFTIAGAAPDPRRPLMAACLAGGPSVVASHLAAAWLWEYGRIEAGAVEVTGLVSWDRALDGVRVHRSWVLLADDMKVRDGIPVTSAPRTAIDLASCLSLYLLARFVDHVVRERFCTVDELDRQLDALGGRGRSGTRMFRLLVRERQEGLGPGDSEAEAYVARTLRAMGVPPALQNHQIVAGDRVFVVDLCWPELRLVVELDGFVPHATRTAFDHDRERDLILRQAGWNVVRISTNTDLHRLAAFIAELSARYGS